MKRKLRTLILAAVLAVTPLIITQPAANAATEINAEVWSDSNYSGSPWLLQWTQNQCSTTPPASYNWYYGTGGGLQYFPLSVAYSMSSIVNYSHYCNEVWLTSGGRYGSGYQGWVYAQCLAYGQGINWFGSPYNDNIQQVGLSRDPSCG